MVEATRRCYAPLAAGLQRALRPRFKASRSLGRPRASDPKAVATGRIWLPRSSRSGRATVNMCWRRFRVGPGADRFSAATELVSRAQGCLRNRGGVRIVKARQPVRGRTPVPGDSTRSATAWPGQRNTLTRRSDKVRSAAVIAPAPPVLLSTQSTWLAAVRPPTRPGGQALSDQVAAVLSDN